LSDFAPHLLPIVFWFKIIIKRGERGQKMGGKIAQKKEGGQNHTIDKKIGAKVQLNTRGSI